MSYATRLSKFRISAALLIATFMCAPDSQASADDGVVDSRKLTAMREKWQMPPEALADRLGVPFQVYMEMEQGTQALESQHLLTLEAIGIDQCLSKQDPSLLVPEVRLSLGETAEG
ncbi:hypothetical protein LGR54_23135 [Ancylobacter sp. Lp-2]|uniref:hypothetical protein n=1 Tax=Ancylobacter sp. Lp-2 TaxID=2881339 RepID=UPI001E2D383E|nr:hypothetical protein [Ancylobacter sp. Lp-2]MCB4771509.1 hypothetical protein [Ancylobacter sp. Lp-2]